uniref:Clip domain-containing protein n=1 Tax=Timema poppense TaxID=170557 RepID=A0A7R9DEV6_TIMPO|nr:unnamed protein product [Timema poppensis]
MAETTVAADNLLSASTLLPSSAACLLPGLSLCRNIDIGRKRIGPTSPMRKLPQDRLPNSYHRGALLGETPRTHLWWKNHSAAVVEPHIRSSVISEEGGSCGTCKVAKLALVSLWLRLLGTCLDDSVCSYKTIRCGTKPRTLFVYEEFTLRITLSINSASSCSGAIEGDPCTTVRGENGTCSLFKSCASALQDFEQGLQSYRCGFQGFDEVVCCKDGLPKLSKSEEDAYKHIGPNADVDSLKKRLTNIIKCYRRELKKVEQSQRSGAEEDYVPSLWYFEELDFLHDQDVQILVVSTIDLEQDEVGVDHAEEASENTLVTPTSYSCSHIRKKTARHMAGINNLLKEALGQLIKKVTKNKDDASVSAERIELVDQVGKEEVHLPPEANLGLMFLELKVYVWRGVLRTWHEQWVSTPAQNKLRSIRDGVSRWPSFRRKSRREEVFVTRIRVGHTSLTHGFLLRKDPPSVCEFCDAPLSVYHILVECREYASIRLALDFKACLNYAKELPLRVTLDIVGGSEANIGEFPHMIKVHAFHGSVVEPSSLTDIYSQLLTVLLPQQTQYMAGWDSDAIGFRHILDSPAKGYPHIPRLSFSLEDTPTSLPF